MTISLQRHGLAPYPQLRLNVHTDRYNCFAFLYGHGRVCNGCVLRIGGCVLFI
jgi:hypothetical protein